MTTTTRGVTLYPHNASALLPLLETRQPLSLPLIGSIHVSGAARVYATFPPSQIPTNGGDDWAVAIAFPAPSTQLHVYHAFESADRAGNGKAEPAGHDEPAACVVALLHLMLALHPTHDRIGGLNILWAAAVREALKSPDYGWNTVYLAPAGGVAAEGVGVDMAGLALDKGKPGDEDCIALENTYNSAEYYRARMEGGYMTALRPSASVRRGGEGQEGYRSPISWILTHANGSLGALFTANAYRRRGLARLVTATHMREARGTGAYRAHVYVTAGNVASEGMWEGAGWEKGWEVTWVAARGVRG